MAIMALGGGFWTSSANACELICLMTNTKYTGNLGGLSGADAKCAAEYPGFKFMRTPMAISRVAGTVASSAVDYSAVPVMGVHSAWTNGPNGTNTCTNWTDGGGWGSSHGSVIMIHNGVYVDRVDTTHNGGSGPHTQCSTARPIWCCNM